MLTDKQIEKITKHPDVQKDNPIDDGRSMGDSVLVWLRRGRCFGDIGLHVTGVDNMRDWFNEKQFIMDCNCQDCVDKNNTYGRGN